MSDRIEELRAAQDDADNWSMSWTCDDEPADNDMGRLLETLAGGGNFNDILDVLASWGGTGGEIDPDLGGVL